MLHCRGVKEVKIWRNISPSVIGKQQMCTNNRALLRPVNLLLVSVCIWVQGQSLVCRCVLVLGYIHSKMSEADYKSWEMSTEHMGKNICSVVLFPIQWCFQVLIVYTVQLKKYLVELLVVSLTVIFITCKANRWRFLEGLKPATHPAPSSFAVCMR